MNTQTNNTKRIATLVVGDILVFLIFALIGRRSHGLSLATITGIFSTVIPFIIGWFIVMPWVGVYREDVSRSWQKLLPLLIFSWPTGGMLAIVLRAVFLGRTLPEGINPSFVVVGISTSALMMIIWRLGYIGYMNRATKKLSDSQAT